MVVSALPNIIAAAARRSVEADNAANIREVLAVVPVVLLEHNHRVEVNVVAVRGRAGQPFDAHVVTDDLRLELKATGAVRKQLVRRRVPTGCTLCLVVELVGTGHKRVRTLGEGVESASGQVEEQLGLLARTAHPDGEGEKIASPVLEKLKRHGFRSGGQHLYNYC